MIYLATSNSFPPFPQQTHEKFSYRYLLTDEIAGYPRIRVDPVSKIQWMDNEEMIDDEGFEEVWDRCVDSFCESIAGRSEEEGNTSMETTGQS